MTKNSRLSLVLHALLHMHELERPVTSEQLSRCLGTNPVVVRRTMAFLRDAGIVRSERGHAGGWSIAVDPSTISLGRLHEALGEPGILALGHHNDIPQCLVERTVNSALDAVIAEAEARLLNCFHEITLAHLVTDFRALLAERQARRRGTSRAVRSRAP